MYTVINLSYEKNISYRHLKSDNKHVGEQSKQNDGSRSSAANPHRRKEEHSMLWPQGYSELQN